MGTEKKKVGSQLGVLERFFRLFRNLLRRIPWVAVLERRGVQEN